MCSNSRKSKGKTLVREEQNMRLRPKLQKNSKIFDSEHWHGQLEQWLKISRQFSDKINESVENLENRKTEFS